MSFRFQGCRLGFILAPLALPLCALAKPCYTQPVESYLRAEPRDGAFLARLPIGTHCELLREVDASWSYVRCLDVDGYVNPHDLGPQRPEARKLLVATREPKKSPSQRMELAMGAAVLAPEDGQIRIALKRLYLDYEFSQLPPDSEGDFTPMQPLDCPLLAKPDACLADVLLPRKTFGSRRRIEHRGKTFVGVGVRDGYLYAVRGASNAWADSSPAARSFTVRSQDFESLDVDLIAAALGFKSEPRTHPSIEYTGNLERDSPRVMSGSRLYTIQEDRSRMLIDLEEKVPPGPANEIRRDLHARTQLTLLFVADFDRDGREDALVKVDTQGNCRVPGYLFASVSQEGKPVVTPVLASSSQAPILGEHEGLLSFTFRAEERQETYVFSRDQGQRVATQPIP